jgi:AcrR family transcriptional regulator
MLRYDGGVTVKEAPRSSPRREKARAATIEEIKTTALALMRESGTTDVRFSDVARSMDMTAPALYRYFSGREELLAALIADGYSDLADHLERSTDGIGAADLAGRFSAVLCGYRSWAKADPTRFALIFGAPLPGYATPQGLGVEESASRAMANLESVIVDAARAGELRPPLLGTADPAIDCTVDTARATAKGDGEIPTASYQAMLHAWLAVHGFVSLDVFGHLEWLPADAQEGLFDSQVQAALISVGLADT